jgi:3-deoxy-D-manno-octulosonic-acid transferase
MKPLLARLVYSSLLRLATPAYLARLWTRGGREPAYRQRWAQRLGFGDGPTPAPGRLWLHAVSLGETRAAAPLIAALRAAHPRLRLLLTHGTATGWQAGTDLLRDGDAQTWLPYDTPGSVRRFLRHHRPALGVVMETEIWPNLQFEARAAGVPMVLANARLSPRSARKGRQLAALLHPALGAFTQVLAQTEADAQRLRASGARQVQVVGNLKFDMTPPPDQLARGRAWAAALGRPVVMGAATREGEETQLLVAWAAALAAATGTASSAGSGPAAQEQPPASEGRQALPPSSPAGSAPPPGAEQRPLLLLVPRHPQRFDDVAALVQASGLQVARRSGWGDEPPAAAQAADVWLGDSLGEMPLYYAAAQVALLGGSFEPLGGQNLIEAAACGCPLLMGPHTFNFALAAEQAIEAGAAERVPSLAVAVPRAIELSTSSHRPAMAAHALAFSAQHRGAAQRMAESILALLASH